MCEIDVSDFEPCTVWDEKAVKARKPHTCDACGAAITPGERYIRHFSVAEGFAEDNKCCAACDVIRIDFSKEHGIQLVPSALRGFLQECADYGESDANTKRWRKAIAEIDSRNPRRKREEAADVAG